MDKMIELSEQHILESASRLRHIDELIHRVRQNPLKEPVSTESQGLFSEIQLNRDKLAQELEELRRLPPGGSPEFVNRAAGLKGALETVGLQLEQVLTAVLVRNA